MEFARNVRQMRAVGVGKRCSSSRSSSRCMCTSASGGYPGQDDSRPALFVAQKYRLALDEAVAHSREAERLYEGKSARIEYCRSKGVDYENVIAYAGYIERLMATVDDVRKHLIVTCDESGKIKIIIGNSAVNRNTTTTGLGCPLCLDPRHRLALCPNLPDELRPFV